MRTIVTRTDVFKFDELSDAAKQKAVENLYDLNVDYDWWDSIYDDAKQIGCKIDGFDTGRGNSIKFVCKDAEETASLILENHGEACETYKLAKQYIDSLPDLDRDTGGELTYAGENVKEDIDAEFQRSLGEEYLSILRHEYDYLTSEEAIIETIKANEFEFTEEGRIFS